MIPTPPKPFLTYEDQLQLLINRGMNVDDKSKAVASLREINYYRLSGFWYVCREPNPNWTPKSGSPGRLNSFIHGSSFEAVIALYNFDTRLRHLVLSGMERIEVAICAAIAYEMGYHNPMAHTMEKYVDPKFLTGSKSENNKWQEWTDRHESLLLKSKEDCIVWHKLSNKSIPIWVAVEAWDFGTMSKYYSIVGEPFREKVSRRFGIKNPKYLRLWLQELNILRNRSAHHTRIWNQPTYQPLQFIDHPVFLPYKNEEITKKRIFGLVLVISYLLSQIDPENDWHQRVLEHIKTKPELPGCTFGAIGIPKSLEKMFQN